MSDTKKKRLRGTVVFYAFAIGLFLVAIVLALAALWAAAQARHD